jgi:hypothetical protein
MNDQRCVRQDVPKRSSNYAKQVQQLDHVIIRFAGDSGDGMQLGGGQVHPADGDLRQ